MTTSLMETQTAFQNYLNKKPSVMQELITGKTSQERERRLMVYREAYILRLQENLSKQYPMLAIALGQEAFNALGECYIQAYPPQGFAIRLFGEALAQYIRDEKKLDAYFAELASLEWAMNSALDCSQEQPLLTVEDLQKLGEARLLTAHFYFQESLKILTFQHDIIQLWHQLKKTHKLPKVQMVPAFHVAVWRKNWQPYFLNINDFQLALVQAARASKNFTELCELAIAHMPEEVALSAVTENVMAWIQNGWLTTFA